MSYLQRALEETETTTMLPDLIPSSSSDTPWLLIGAVAVGSIAIIGLGCWYLFKDSDEEKAEKEKKQEKK